MHDLLIEKAVVVDGLMLEFFGQARVPQPIVFVTGEDPTTAIGGHGTYVRAHARAAQRGGFEPHIFCWSTRGAVVETDIGILHRVQLLSRLDHLPWFKFRTQKMV